MMQISEKAKKIAAAIVFIGILMSAAAWAGYGIGKDQGIDYQKEQPVMLHIDDARGTNVINTHEIALSDKGTISLSTDSQFVTENNITQYWITLSKN